MSVNDSCYVRLFDFFDNKPSHFILPFSSITEATNFCELYKERKRLEDPDILCTPEPIPQYDGELGIAQGGQNNLNFFQLFLGYGSTYTKKYNCDFIITTILPEDTNDPKKFPVFETFQEFLNAI